MKFKFDTVRRRLNRLLKLKTKLFVESADNYRTAYDHREEIPLYIPPETTGLRIYDSSCNSSLDLIMHSNSQGSLEWVVSGEDTKVIKINRGGHMLKPRVAIAHDGRIFYNSTCDKHGPPLGTFQNFLKSLYLSGASQENYGLPIELIRKLRQLYRKIAQVNQQSNTKRLSINQFLQSQTRAYR